MPDQLKRIINATAYQTTGTGLTSTSNTGGIYSGGKLATLYTAPANTTCLLRCIYVAPWNGSNTPDAFVTLHFRVVTGAPDFFGFTFSQSDVALGGVRQSFDTEFYVINAGSSFEAMILPSDKNRYPVENSANTNTMLENIALTVWGIEVV